MTERAMAYPSTQRQRQRRRRGSHVGLVLASLAVAAFGSASVDASEGAGRPGCVGVAGEARYRGYGYDHVVRITNGCEKAATCSVSTDVNAVSEKVTIGRNETLEVVTFRGSPAREFVPRVECRLR